MATVELNLTREGVDVDCHACGPLHRFSDHDDVAAAARIGRAHIEDVHGSGELVVPSYEIVVPIGQAAHLHAAE